MMKTIAITGVLACLAMSSNAQRTRVDFSCDFNTPATGTADPQVPTSVGTRFWCGMSHSNLWNVDEGGTTPSSSTGPARGQAGTTTDNYAHLETSRFAGVTDRMTSILETPALTLSSTGGSVSFYYHMYGATMGTLSFHSCASSRCTMLWNQTGQQHTSMTAAWTQVTLAVPVGTTTVRWIGVNGVGIGSWTGDMSVDTISITAPLTTAPTLAPTNMPTTSPTFAPTTSPTFAPTTSPTFAPTAAPTMEPTAAPTNMPTTSPTEAPTASPTSAPTLHPCTPGGANPCSASTVCARSTAMTGPNFVCQCNVAAGFTVRVSDLVCATAAPTAGPPTQPQSEASSSDGDDDNNNMLLIIIIVVVAAVLIVGIILYSKSGGSSSSGGDDAKHASSFENPIYQEGAYESTEPAGGSGYMDVQ